MHNAKRIVVATAISASVAVAVAQSSKVDFEKDDVGKSPKGFSFALTGQGKPGVWIVKKDDQAHGNVLVQSDADATDYRFPVAVYDDVNAKDVDLSVQFKGISGKGDQGAGIVWRYRDQNNYYITRCNALEDNCTIYHVVNGRRQAFLNQSVKVASNLSRAVALVDQGLTAAYVPETAATIPDRYKSANGMWTGFGARIRVILYNTDKVTLGEAPRSILDLTQPRWKGRFAIANPHFGTMSFQAAALFVKWGDAKASDFLRRLNDNGAVVAAGNSDVKDRVADGRVDIGILDEDDAVVAVREKKPVAIAIPDQNGSDALGTPLMPNVALLIQGAPHVEQGQRFIDFLVSADAEKILADSDAAQYPLHPGVAGPKLLPPLN